MFARHPRHHASAFALALLFTVGMLGAVDSLATHPADDAMLAAAAHAAHPVVSLQCPSRV